MQQQEVLDATFSKMFDDSCPSAWFEYSFGSCRGTKQGDDG